jgi:serine/threonine protein kinase, bacterial
MPLVDGATAAGFSIVRLLGHGQIGELYLAEHPRLPRQDALKIVSADLSADAEYRYRFKQESGRAAALWHPNIVSLHDRGEFEDRLWLSMDYVDGTDAAQLLTEIYPEGMPPDIVVEIVFAIADALDYAHELGLVHRYVNPSNILISNLESRRRRILLTGFGLPRRPDETNSLARANLAIGTASYAAPEQLMDDPIDGRTDQYALASTAFQLLTGSAPFAHMNPAVLISKHLDELPPQPGDVRPELTYFDAPFARALKKNPSERFRRCRDFARALESKEGLGPYLPSVAAAELLAVPETHNGVPPQPPAPPPAAAALAAPLAAEVDDAFTADPPPQVLPQAAVSDAFTVDAAPDGLPEADFDDAFTADAPPDSLPEADFDDAFTADAPPDVPPETDVDDELTFAESDVWSAASDDRSIAARRRRLLQTVGLAVTIATVALGGILGVMALRSASQPDDTAPNVETPSSVTTVPSARPAPATRVIPPPMVIPPAPKATTPSASTPSSAATTTAPATSSSPETTQQPTTRPHSSSPTPPTGLDTRPAVGMPCGAAGASTVANSGAPVNCVETPGGFAWEPPGG